MSNFELVFFEKAQKENRIIARLDIKNVARNLNFLPIKLSDYRDLLERKTGYLTSEKVLTSPGLFILKFSPLEILFKSEGYNLLLDSDLP